MSRNQPGVSPETSPTAGPNQRRTNPPRPLPGGAESKETVEPFQSDTATLSRVAARAVESGPDGENLAAGAWQRLEALPDPRSPQGRVYPLACLIAIALCAFTAAGNDRFTAVGQWIRRAGQADLARLHAPWDPIAGRYRAPDEKTIRVVREREIQ